MLGERVELLGPFAGRFPELRVEGLGVVRGALAELPDPPHYGGLGLLDVLCQRGRPIVEDRLDLGSAAFHLPLEIT